MNRLKEIRKYLNCTQKDFAKKLGVKQNTVSYWENGKRQIDIETAKRISDLAGCTVEYLIGGEMTATPITVIEEVITGVPVDAIVDVTGGESITGEKKNCFAMRVKEDGMAPLIMENDVIIVKPTEKAAKGDIVLVRMEDGKFLIKEYLKYKSGITLFSYNKNYSPIFYTNEEIKNLPIKIIGRVIEQRRKF